VPNKEVEGVIDRSQLVNQVEANLLEGGKSLKVEVCSISDLKPTPEAREGDWMDWCEDVLEWSRRGIQVFWRRISDLVQELEGRVDNTRNVRLANLHVGSGTCNWCVDVSRSEAVDAAHDTAYNRSISFFLVVNSRYPQKALEILLRAEFFLSRHHSLAKVGEYWIDAALS